MRTNPHWIALALLAAACGGTSRSATDLPDASGATRDAGQASDAGTKPDAGSSTPAFSEVYAILDASCVSCHFYGGSGTSGGGPDFSSRTATYSILVNQTATGQFCNDGRHTRVIPGDPEHSLLYQKVSKTQDCGAQMPWGEPPHYPPLISAADQKTIHDWIAAGAQNSP